MTRDEAKALVVGDRVQYDGEGGWARDRVGGQVHRAYTPEDATVGILWDDEAFTDLRVDDPSDRRLAHITREAR